MVLFPEEIDRDKLQGPKSQQRQLYSSQSIVFRERDNVDESINFQLTVILFL